MIHKASCTCGQLTLTYHGEIKRTSICHCTACQQRTGSAFGVQARVKIAEVETKGASTKYERIADSGGRVVFFFCPTCGTTVFWELTALPGYYGVAFGAFAESSSLPAPIASIYEARKHSWVLLPPSITTHIN